MCPPVGRYVSICCQVCVHLLSGMCPTVCQVCVHLLSGMCPPVVKYVSTCWEVCVHLLAGMCPPVVRYVSTCCQASGSCGDQEWKLAFRGTAGVRQSVLTAYKDSTFGSKPVESGCKQVGQNLPCANHYRNNDILDNWSGVSEVALVIYKNNVKVKQVIFDGSGTNYINWFDKARVKDSSWIDMKTSSANYFSIDGHQDPTLRRTFFMSQAYGTCPNDVGWFVAVDSNGGCPWEQNSGIPMLKYSTSDSKMNWNAPTIGQADYFAVLVRRFNVPS
ncbi:uncharacterized protein LOC106072155 isoform X1 [Biomphalaria glabrata]|uniref:Uncharacterized protein LOC106072155 isoform X1 n=1 Tax=Biomphalaria glabrata TaxID=6526 RepID=A0A9W3ARD0_BIOGL|nr:uncharacterized protein LOC106072155 isoform X1 [Biomphalaria glabrata]